jgi:tRNA 5-methylaminomethyl-2-thiouridine biosynthesis bifunctional protein
VPTRSINRNNQVWQPTPAAALDWVSANTPGSTEFSDVYYSPENGQAESRYVFIDGSALPERWRTHPRRCFTICEAGFGTGLNFLLTWKAWRESGFPRPQLHYVAIEKYPLCAADLARALGAWPELADSATRLLANYPGRRPGQHRLVFADGQILLDLWWEDISATLFDLAGREQAWVDAWYLDGFAPARNGSMWQQENFQAMAALSLPLATVATFTAAGAVRRGLAEAGFSVHKVTGYGRKRENLRAQLPAGASGSRTWPSPRQTPWDLAVQRQAAPASALVVGAGLAGCHVAAALARRGVRVTLLEQAEVAGAGSGNNQGVLYTRLSRRHSPLGDFALQSFTHAGNHYRAMFARGLLEHGIDGDLCGSFHQSDARGELDAIAPGLAELPELASVLRPDEAERVLGISQPHGGYWYPQSGWLNPAAVCRALLASGSVDLREHCGPLRLEQNDTGWRAHNEATVVVEADIAVVAAGTGCKTFPSLQWLPLQSIRGQTSELPTAASFAALRCVLCHEGYIAPARRGVHSIGATFNLLEQGHQLRASDHDHNLQSLARAVPAWAGELAGVDPGELAGRVGYRCASPDYLPLVGPAPALAEFLQTFAPLRKNARQLLNHRGNYLHGLYLCTGHGSRGLTSTPLAAELLASQICQEPPPLARELERALAPARFLIRDLGRNRQ